MAGVPLPKPVSVAQFVPDPNEPTFTQIFHDTMGNLGSSADGFDDAFNDLLAMQPPSGGQDAVMGPSAVQLSAVRDAVAAGPLRGFSLGFQSAIAAGNDKFNTVARDLGPSNSALPPVNPPTGQPPASPPPACTPPADNPAKVLPQMKVGDAPLVMYIDSETNTPGGDPLDIRGNVLCGDTSIFSAQKVQRRTGYGANGPATETTLNFVITPAMEGTFTGAYEETEVSTGILTDTWVTVTIVTQPKTGEGGQPLPVQP